MSFSSLKKSAGDFDALRSKIKPQNNGGESDNYYPDVDAAGNGYAVVRFLPAKNGSDHLVTYSKFFAKNSNGTKTYKALNRKSIGLDDPHAEYLAALWAQNTDEAKALYRARKRKIVTVGYVQVIDDKVNKDNNGKIAKFFMPMTIKKKIEEAIDPENPFNDPDIQAFNPFDIFGNSGGRNFIIKIKNKDGYRNYEDSKFVDEPSPWLDDEKEMEKLWEEHVTDLTEIIKEEKFPTYEKALSMLVETYGSEPLSNRIIKDLFGSKINGASEMAEESVKEKHVESKQASEPVNTVQNDDDFDFDDDIPF